MRLHHAIKRPGMKYPRATNRCLDAGMILMLGGAAGVATTALGIAGDVTADVAVVALVAGFISYAIAAHLSKINADAKPEPTRLHRVK